MSPLKRQTGDHGQLSTDVASVKVIIHDMGAVVKISTTPTNLLILWSADRREVGSAFDHVINQTESFCLFCGHVIVTLQSTFDRFI